MNKCNVSSSRLFNTYMRCDDVQRKVKEYNKPIDFQEIIFTSTLTQLQTLSITSTSLVAKWASIGHILCHDNKLRLVQSDSFWATALCWALILAWKTLSFICRFACCNKLFSDSSFSFSLFNVCEDTVKNQPILCHLYSLSCRISIRTQFSLYIIT